MNFSELNLFNILSGIGVLMAGAGVSYAQFKAGNNKETIAGKDDLIKTLREAATAEKEKAERLAAEKVYMDTSYQKQLNDLNARIGKLQGLYESNEKQKDEYLKILQGRSPEQENFMKLVVAQIEKGEKQAPAIAEYMTTTVQVLAEIKTFMEKLNKKAKNTERFQKDVAKATKREKGHVLRKE